jgi:mannose-6-phosphate isomerase-like protein (cupin superfamily)
MAALLDESLELRLRAHVARHADKLPDWDAFPSNRGFPELERAQFRYIGAGGSPKTDDPGTLKAGAFTLSMVHQPVGKYAAAHSHEVEEAFLVLQGVLTIAWEYDGEVIFTRCGPKDLVLQARNRAHGFRNEGVEPVLVSIMVGKGKPMPPAYAYHPKKDDPGLAAAFGAKPGKTFALCETSNDPRHREFAQHVVRFSRQKPAWHAAGFAHLPYIGPGGAPARTFREELIVLPKGVAVKPYARSCEDAFLVLEGCLTVGWLDGGNLVEQRLGPRDLVLNPPGQLHYFRNDGFQDAQFMMIVGTPQPEDVAFQAA